MNFPHKTKAKKAQELQYDVYLIINDNRILLSKDWKDGLMIDYIRLPMVKRGVQTSFEHIQFVEKRKHVFSHRIWEMDFYKASISELEYDHDLWFWFPLDKLKEISMVTAHSKWLQKEGLL